MQKDNKAKIELRIQKFCPHCNNNSVQDYLLHHYSVKQIGHKMIKTGNDASHSDIKPETVPLIRNFFSTLLNHVYILPMQIQEWDSLNP